MNLVLAIVVGLVAIYAEFWLWETWQAAREYREYHRWDQAMSHEKANP